MVRGKGDRERIIPDGLVIPDGLEPGDIVHWKKGTRWEDVDVYVCTDRVDVISIGRSLVIIPMRFDVIREDGEWHYDDY